jgi:hypothetical protein
VANIEAQALGADPAGPDITTGLPFCADRTLPNIPTGGTVLRSEAYTP